MHTYATDLCVCFDLPLDYDLVMGSSLSLYLSLASTLFRFDFLKSCGSSSRFSILAPWLTRTFTEHNEFDQPLKSHHEATQFYGILCMFFPFRALNFSRVVKWKLPDPTIRLLFLLRSTPSHFIHRLFSVCHLASVNTDSTLTDFLTHFFLSFDEMRSRFFGIALRYLHTFTREINMAHM